MPFKIYKELFSTFDKKRKSYTKFIFLIFLLVMVLELFSVALFIPFISFIVNTNIVDSKFYIFFMNNLNLDFSFILSDIKYFIAFFFFIFLLKSILIIFCNWHKIGFVYKIRKYFTHNIFKKYLNSPYEIFIEKNSSEYLKNINYEINATSEGVLQILEFILEILVVIGIITFLFSYNFEVTSIIVLISIISIFLISHFTKNKVSNLGERVRIFEQFRLKNYLESFHLFKEIKIYKKEKEFLNRDLKFTSDFLNTDFLFRFIKSIPRVLLELLIISIFLILIFINLDIENPINTLENLTVYAAAGYRIFPSTTRIISSLQSIKYALPSIRNIVHELELSKKSVLLENKNKNKKVKIKKFTNSIYFSNISFKYRNTDEYILKNFNLRIDKNSIIGIKGKTGKGKSTIINLLSGLLYPSNGSIIIDDINYNDIDISSIHKLIGLVPQYIYLMDTSIKENITFLSADVTNDDLESAVQNSSLKNFVEKLPDGLETIIGEKNNKISGGQAQRIGLARALIKKPQILILDEPTNALDSETESEILTNLTNLKNNLTVIIISHDDNALKICDNIIDLSLNKQ